MSPPEASRRDGRGRAVAWGTSAAVLIGVLLRTVYLDADPDYYAWIGYITDEGRWIETARSLILVGNPADYGFNVHFWVAPLFQLAHVPVFALLGVSFWSSRLLSSLAGSALLVWLAVRLRDRVPFRWHAGPHASARDQDRIGPGGRHPPGCGSPLPGAG